jgi:hypothetical protein
MTLLKKTASKAELEALGRKWFDEMLTSISKDKIDTLGKSIEELSRLNIIPDDPINYLQRPEKQE